MYIRSTFPIDAMSVKLWALPGCHETVIPYLQMCTTDREGVDFLGQTVLRDKPSNVLSPVWQSCSTSAVYPQGG